MPTNDFLPYATAGGANVLSQSDYAGEAARLAGVVAGTAKSSLANKSWRQSASMAAMLGQFIADRGGVDALDNGNLATLLDAFETAYRSQATNFFTAGGTANALTATLDPVPASWASLTGTPFRFVVSTANTGAATLNLNGLGAKDIVYPGDNSPMLAGELIAGAIRTGLYDGTRVQLIDAGSRARAGVSWRGMLAITATAAFNPATYGLTSTDKMLGLLWAAGGGAASQISSSGAGGSGGGFAAKVFAAQAATVTIGAGGAGNMAGSNGGTGGTTSFGSLFSATGGGGAGGGPNSGGQGVGGDVNISGSAGDDMLGTGHNFAKGGAAPLMGLISPVNYAAQPIGGGGSAVYVSGTHNYAGDGGPGLAILIY